ncbi:SDR family oxidoreductase [Liquorilactobacillus mali]|uniref:SDR family oxidoreductase n=1 Tax=Liquorilactobacillus mali TaxID=1618 RepID=UPI0029532B89|nr:SDR family oxidoreductase [Liquorilactobacillus mali]MDV7756875.1 SDR family oxidoreductase [Liquorilactobacillus mali]
MELKNKRILIVGGTSGFGKEVALQCLKQGAHVSVIGHSNSHLKEFIATSTQSPSTSNLKGTALDATDQKQLADFFANHKSFDHIVSTLGGAMGGGFLDNSLTKIRKVIEGKFFANLQLAQLAVSHLNKGGSLTFTSGTGGHPSTASGAIVGNHAINLLVKGLAIEVASQHKRVNAVAPTWTATGLWRDLSPTQLQQQKQSIAAGIPLKRTAKVTEVASAYLYLITNDFMTGQIINVDGGVSAL